MELNAMQKETFLASLEKVIKDTRKQTRKECDKLAIEQLANDTNSNTLNICIAGNKIGTIRITDAGQEINIADEEQFRKWAVNNHLGNEWEETIVHFDLSPNWKEYVQIKHGDNSDCVIDYATGEVLDFLEVVDTPASTRVYANTDGIRPAFNALGSDAMPQLLGGSDD